MFTVTLWNGALQRPTAYTTRYETEAEAVQVARAKLKNCQPFVEAFVVDASTGKKTKVTR